MMYSPTEKIVRACEKLILLNKNRSFAIGLHNACILDTVNGRKILSRRFSTEQKQSRRTFFLDDAWSTLRRNVNSQNNR